MVNQQDTGVTAEEAAALAPQEGLSPCGSQTEPPAANAHTPGPWSWFGNAGSNSLYLATTHSGRRYVMGFRRWGFSGAQPCFQPAERGLVDASKLCTFQVGDRSVRGVEEAKANASVYRLDIDGIDCADARLIAAAPELLEVAKTLLAFTKGTIERAGLTDTNGIVAASEAVIAKVIP